MMLGFKLLNCHIYLHIIGIVTSDTFVVYTFWTYFNSLFSVFWLYWPFMMKNMGESWTVYTSTLVKPKPLLRMVLNFQNPYIMFNFYISVRLENAGRKLCKL